MMKSMHMGERGQVTVPKEKRLEYGLKPRVCVEFVSTRDGLLLRKVTPKTKRDPIEEAYGCCKGKLQELGFANTDEYIEALRGR